MADGVDGHQLLTSCFLLHPLDSKRKDGQEESNGLEQTYHDAPAACSS